jgi:hypothetical protein
MNMRALFLCTTVVAAAGCGGGTDVPTAPTLKTDIQGTLYPANSTSVYNTTAPTVKSEAGTTAFGSLQVQNVGSQTLNVTAVSLAPKSGTPANVFVLNPGVATALPKALAYNDIWPVEVQCSSTTANTTFGATLTVTSNDANSPFTISVECTFYPVP